MSKKKVRISTSHQLIRLYLLLDKMGHLQSRYSILSPLVYLIIVYRSQEHRCPSTTVVIYKPNMATRSDLLSHRRKLVNLVEITGQGAYHRFPSAIFFDKRLFEAADIIAYWRFYSLIIELIHKLLQIYDIWQVSIIIIIIIILRSDLLTDRRKFVNILEINGQMALVPFNPWHLFPAPAMIDFLKQLT